jgi:23S rRNA (cytosine1962-C5)-methyltransferase
MNTILIRQGREKSILHRHPWIFKSALKNPDEAIEPGSIVAVAEESGTKLGFAFCNPKSQITLRMIAYGTDVKIDDDFWENTIAAAVTRRTGLTGDGRNTACRLIYGEADFLPGLIADRYGDFIVLQCLTAGIEKLKPAVVDVLTQLLKPAGIYERSDADVRRLEGLPETRGLLYGKEPPADLTVQENGLSFVVNLSGGQKTGFFLDQRLNRSIVASYADGRNVLDCFSYSGGFALNALRAGAASVHAVDSSSDALAALQANAGRNGLDTTKLTVADADVFQYLRTLRDEGRKFGMVVLDPPKLAPTKTQVERAVRAYKDVNLMAMKLMEPGGILATFSCSGGLPTEEFRRIVGWAARDNGRELQVLRVLTQFEDHPVRMNYPESEYLKGLVVRVI